MCGCDTSRRQPTRGGQAKVRIRGCASPVVAWDKAEAAIRLIVNGFPRCHTALLSQAVIIGLPVAGEVLEPELPRLRSSSALISISCLSSLAQHHSLKRPSLTSLLLPHWLSPEHDQTEVTVCLGVAVALQAIQDKDLSIA